MCPSRRSRIAGSTARDMYMAEKTLMSNISRQWAGSDVSVSPGRRMPALFTRISMRP